MTGVPMLPNATDQCGFQIFESCNCGDQCKSATVPLSKWNDMSGVFTVPARVQIAFIAWVTITGLIGFGAIHLNNHYAGEDRRNQELIYHAN